MMEELNESKDEVRQLQMKLIDAEAELEKIKVAQDVNPAYVGLDSDQVAFKINLSLFKLVEKINTEHITEVKNVMDMVNGVILQTKSTDIQSNKLMKKAEDTARVIPQIVDEHDQI